MQSIASSHNEVSADPKNVCWTSLFMKFIALLHDEVSAEPRTKCWTCLPMKVTGSRLLVAELKKQTPIQPSEVGAGMQTKQALALQKA